MRGLPPRIPAVLQFLHKLSLPGEFSAVSFDKLRAVSAGLRAVVKFVSAALVHFQFAQAKDLDPHENIFSFNNYGVNCNFFMRVLRGTCGGIEGPGVPGTNEFAIFDHPFG
jgi:hypothetical protein